MQPEKKKNPLWRRWTDWTAPAEQMLVGKLQENRRIGRHGSFQRRRTCPKTGTHFSFPVCDKPECNGAGDADHNTKAARMKIETIRAWPRCRCACGRSLAPAPLVSASSTSTMRYNYIVNVTISIFSCASWSHPKSGSRFVCSSLLVLQPRLYLIQSAEIPVFWSQLAGDEPFPHAVQFRHSSFTVIFVQQTSSA